MSAEPDAYTAALLRERAALDAYGHASRVKAVDAELARIGYSAPAPAARADEPKPVKRTTTRKG